VAPLVTYTKPKKLANELGREETIKDPAPWTRSVSQLDRQIRGDLSSCFH